MRRTFRYSTGGRTEEDIRRGLRAHVEELGYEPVETVIKQTGSSGENRWFDVSFTLDLPDSPDPLQAQVERAIAEERSPVRVALSQIEGFADLYWDPMNRRELWINEIVRLDGPTRYGVIGFLSGEFRICVCSNDDQPYEPGFVAAEHDLRVAVARVLHYIERGLARGSTEPDRK